MDTSRLPPVAPDTPSLHARLAALVTGVVPSPTDWWDAVQAATQASPFVERSRSRVIAVQVALDTLLANEVAALVQLEANRDAVLVALSVGAVAGVEALAVEAAFVSGVDAVYAAATGKRVGLETELVAADAALDEAIDATAAILEVRPDFRPSADLFIMPPLPVFVNRLV